MCLRIQNNVEAFNAQRQLSATRDKLARPWRSSPAATASTAPPTTPPASRSARSCAARSAVSPQAQRNAQDAISLVQTAEGALNEVHSMLQRVRELAVQYKNGTLSTSDQPAIQSEVNQLSAEIERIGTERTSSTASSCSSARPTSRSRSAPTTASVRPRGDLDRPSLAAASADPAISDVGLDGVALVRRHRRTSGDRRCDQERLRASAPSSVRCRTVSSTRLNNLADVPGEPDRVREPYPRRGHGRGDGQVHEAPDPAAGRHEHARAGQPGAAVRPVAAPLAVSSRRTTDWRAARSALRADFALRRQGVAPLQPILPPFIKEDDHVPSDPEQRRGVQTHRQLAGNSDQLGEGHGEALQSGYRINRAGDDAAGLAISEKLRGQIGGLAQASRNASDAISMVQTAEGALNEVHSMLQRVRELAVQYKNGTLSYATTRRRSSRRSTSCRPRSAASATETKFNGIELLKSASTDDLVPGRCGRRPADHAWRPTISVGSAAGGLSDLTGLSRRR